MHAAADIDLALADISRRPRIERGAFERLYGARQIECFWIRDRADRLGPHRRDHVLLVPKRFVCHRVVLCVAPRAIPHEAKCQRESGKSSAPRDAPAALIQVAPTRDDGSWRTRLLSELAHCCLSFSPRLI